MQYVSQQTSVPSKAPALSEAALELLWPTRCAGCEMRGALLCACCNEELLSIEQRYACQYCGAPFGHLVCTECYSSAGKETHPFSAAVAAVEMSELSGRITVLYKDNDEHRLSKIIAARLASRIPASWVRWAEVLTWIPADKKALRRRGFDHMQRVAEDLAELVQLPSGNLLSKRPGRDQRQLKRGDRFDNLTGLLSVRASALPLPERIMLIDDVHTTGATLSAGALKLLEAGAKEVRVASFVRVW